jgi:glycosyltransferase involved in cell wall biosynthesis
MLVRNKHSNDPKIFEAPYSNSFAFRYGKIVQKHYIDQHRTHQWNTLFSLAWPGVDIQMHELILDADIIHLHWIWNFLSTTSIASLMSLGKPLVWTFHDQRAMTGGCHFTATCSRYTSNCNGCEQLTSDPCGLTSSALADQAYLWQQHAVAVVGPSNWMAYCARRSMIWKKSRIEVIPYSVDTEAFDHLNKIECRRQLGLVTECQYVLFGAHQGNEIRKGFQVLIQAVNSCCNDTWFSKQINEKRIRFLCFGKPSEDILECSVPIHSLGYINDKNMLALAYNAANFFIHSSTQDNLPNTVLESMSCGTPVLAMDVGGIPDMVEDGLTGWLISPHDHSGMAAKIIEILKHPEQAFAMSSNCRRHILDKFTNDIQASKYNDLYNDLIKNNKSKYDHLQKNNFISLNTDLECGQKMKLFMINALNAFIAKRGYFALSGNPKFFRAIRKHVKHVKNYEKLLFFVEIACDEINKKDKFIKRIMQPLATFLKKNWSPPK